MSYFFASLLFAVTTSIATATSIGLSSSTNISQSLISSAASFIQLPEAKGRTGSKRVGGYNGRGKGSRYIGGRRK